MTPLDVKPFAGERPLRVIMVGTSFPDPARRTSGVFNLRAAQALGCHVQITVIQMRAWVPGRAVLRASEYEGVRVHRLTIPQLPGGHPVNKSVYRWFGWPLIRSLVQHCDLIHSVDGWCAGVVASAWGRWARVRHVAQMIGSDVNLQLPRMREHRCIRGWERHVGGVACNSQTLAQAFGALYPHVPNVRTVYRGVDLERFHPEGPGVGPLVDEPGVRFLFMGGFRSCSSHERGLNLKGGETLLAAWQAAEAEMPEPGPSLLVAGQRSDSEQVARWRAGLQRPERVHLAGSLSPESVPAYLRSADVVLVPSLYEGLPNVAMEASACGRPVFGSNVGGVPEVIVHGHTGLLLPAGDVAAWKAALVGYAANGQAVRPMGEKARERMEACFDRRQFAPKMLDLYRTVLAEGLD
jgi:glycosyltransferase involved in cell wall biosynthesis